MMYNNKGNVIGVLCSDPKAVAKSIALLEVEVKEKYMNVEKRVTLSFFAKERVFDRVMRELSKGSFVNIDFKIGGDIVADEGKKVYPEAKIITHVISEGKPVDESKKEESKELSTGDKDTQSVGTVHNTEATKIHVGDVPGSSNSVGTTSGSITSVTTEANYVSTKTVETVVGTGSISSPNKISTDIPVNASRGERIKGADSNVVPAVNNTSEKAEVNKESSKIESKEIKEAIDPAVNESKKVVNNPTNFKREIKDTKEKIEAKVDDKKIIAPVKDIQQYKDIKANNFKPSNNTSPKAVSIDKKNTYHNQNGSRNNKPYATIVRVKECDENEDSENNIASVAANAIIDMYNATVKEKKALREQELAEMETALNESAHMNKVEEKGNNSSSANSNTGPESKNKKKKSNSYYYWKKNKQKKQKQKEKLAANQ